MYLGQEIEQGKLEMYTAEVASLRAAPHSETTAEIPSFLGICNVFLSFIGGYSKVASLLYNMTKKGQPIKLEPFGQAEEKAFDDLIERVKNPEVVALPRNELFYSLHTLASEQKFGAAHCKEDKQVGTKRQPIGYWSKSLNDDEKRYLVPLKRRVSRSCG